MSETLQTYITYDHSKTITGIECSTVYITSFQNIIQHEILSSDRIETVGETFKKFDQIVTAGTRIDKGEVLTKEETEAMPKLDEWEAKIYTLFSLLQEMKYKAKQQGLEIETKTTATKEDLKEMTEMVKSGKDISDKLKDLESKLKIVK
tara:strand:+ start:2113 stop:2559 length:447 start_codon:yes stop_codon:yes gene_type:complete